MLLVASVAVGFADAQVLSVNVATDKFKYLYRDMVQIYGNVTYGGSLVDNGFVALQVTNPTGDLIAARTVPANRTPPFPSIVEIPSLFTCNAAGVPKSSFTKYESVYFNVTVKNNVEYATNILILLNAYDFDLTPIGVRTLETNLPAGGLVSYFSDMSLEPWVSEGNATLFASVWSDWLQNLGFPYCPEKNASFTISRVAAPAMIEGVPASYNAFFRLPPESILGAYQIRVCASSGGFIARGTGVFEMEYQERGDLVYDRKIDIFDVVTITASYDSQSGNQIWNPQADVRPDGIVDIFDVTLVTGKYDMSY